jgi:hypothetical protein
VAGAVAAAAGLVRAPLFAAAPARSAGRSGLGRAFFAADGLRRCAI